KTGAAAGGRPKDRYASSASQLAHASVSGSVDTWASPTMAAREATRPPRSTCPSPPAAVGATGHRSWEAASCGDCWLDTCSPPCWVARGRPAGPPVPGQPPGSSFPLAEPTPAAAQVLGSDAGGEPAPRRKVPAWPAVNLRD